MGNWQEAKRLQKRKIVGTQKVPNAGVVHIPAGIKLVQRRASSMAN